MSVSPTGSTFSPSQWTLKIRIGWFPKDRESVPRTFTEMSFSAFIEHRRYSPVCEYVSCVDHPVKLTCSSFQFAIFYLLIIHFIWVVICIQDHIQSLDLFNIKYLTFKLSIVQFSPVCSVELSRSSSSSWTCLWCSLRLSRRRTRVPSGYRTIESMSLPRSTLMTFGSRFSLFKFYAWKEKIRDNSKDQMRSKRE